MNNRKNIKMNKPLSMDYKKLKPFLRRIGFAPVIRRHIRGRIKGKIVSIPPSDFMYAAMADTAIFTDGKKAEELYKRAIQGNKKIPKHKKTKRIKYINIIIKDFYLLFNLYERIKMETETNFMQAVADKKYTEFSTAVKQEMLNKMGNNPDVKAYTSEFDRIQNMKKLFSQINKAGE